MENYLTHDIILHLVVFQAVLLLIVISNAWLLHRSGRHREPPVFPRLSILLPARDEEGKIGDCVRSLLGQDYPDFEVLVLDDNSQDGTRAVLEEISRADPRLKVLVGADLPEGWLGKPWACEQLAGAAQGDILFFSDADTHHQAGAARAAVATLLGEGADLLTGFPRQKLGSWGERLVVPFFAWAFYCFTPLWLAYRLCMPGLSNAIGQMLLFRREAYRAAGGHAGVRDCIAEDLALARRVKAARLRWRVMDATRIISCRMYESGCGAVAGLSKNLFAAFEFRLLPYAFVFLWLAVMFWLPLGVAGLHLAGMAPLAQPPVLAACIGLSLLLWLVPFWRLRIPAWLALLYPLILLVNELVGVRSTWLSLTGRLTWKERTLPRPRWRWL